MGYFEEGKMLVKTKLLILLKKGKLIKSPFSCEKCYKMPPKINNCKVLSFQLKKKRLNLIIEDLGLVLTVLYKS